MAELGAPSTTSATSPFGRENLFQIGGDASQYNWGARLARFETPVMGVVAAIIMTRCVLFIIHSNLRDMGLWPDLT